MIQLELESTPNESLYVTGLNDKIKIEDLKFTLYTLFQQYGEIIQIVMKKTNKLRGQAFIVFQNITYATNAKSALNGMAIFDRPLRVEFAKQRSFIFDRMEGKFYYKKKQPKEQKPNLPSEIGIKKSNKLEEKLNNNPALITVDAEINNVLLVEQLPEIVTEAILSHLFSQYPGYINNRIISGRGLAFIEYENDDQAAVALRGLNGFKLTQDIQLQVKYARKD